jgi:hypothetical protein
MALFALIFAVAALIASGLLAGLGVSSLKNLQLNESDYLVNVMTQWASLPIALALLGAALLAWYQLSRSLSEIDRYESPGDEQSGEKLEVLERDITSARGHLRRGRFAVFCTAVLALLTAAASIARLAWEFYYARLGTLGQGVRWFSYAEIVIGCVAVVIPALGCVVLGPFVWKGGSREAAADDGDKKAMKETEGSMTIPCFLASSEHSCSSGKRAASSPTGAG